MRDYLIPLTVWLFTVVLCVTLEANWKKLVRTYRKRRNKWRAKKFR